MGIKDEITGIGLKVASEGTDRLVILVCKDGTINRSGSGKLNDTKDTFYIGVTKEPLFDRVMARLDDKLFQYIGQEIAMNDPKGIPCKLTIHFMRGALGADIVIHYGHLSGFPAEALSAVKALLEDTQGWYEHHKSAAEKKEYSHRC